MAEPSAVAADDSGDNHIHRNDAVHTKIYVTTPTEAHRSSAENLGYPASSRHCLHGEGTKKSHNIDRKKRKTKARTEKAQEAKGDSEGLSSQGKPAFVAEDTTI